jgi:hypothetical protein
MRARARLHFSAIYSRQLYACRACRLPLNNLIIFPNNADSQVKTTYSNPTYSSLRRFL